jgi:hypothetical protein
MFMHYIVSSKQEVESLQRIYDIVMVECANLRKDVQSHTTRFPAAYVNDCVV